MGLWCGGDVNASPVKAAGAALRQDKRKQMPFPQRIYGELVHVSFGGLFV